MKIFGGKKILEFILIAFSSFCYGNFLSYTEEKFKPQFLLLCTLLSSSFLYYMYTGEKSRRLLRKRLAGTEKSIRERERLSIKSWNLKTQFACYKNYGWISSSCKKKHKKRVERTLDISEKKIPLLINKISTAFCFSLSLTFKVLKAYHTV